MDPVEASSDEVDGHLLQLKGNSANVGDGSTLGKPNKIFRVTVKGGAAAGSGAKNVGEDPETASRSNGSSGADERRGGAGPTIQPADASPTGIAEWQPEGTDVEPFPTGDKVTAIELEQIHENGAAPNDSEDTPSKYALFLKEARPMILLVVLVLIALIYHTQRMGWSWQFSIYWSMITALTVGYGDSISCPHRAEGNGTNSTRVCREIMDATGDMMFTILFAIVTVTVIQSIFIQFLTTLEKKERAMLAHAQRKLLESYHTNSDISVDELTDHAIEGALEWGDSGGAGGSSSNTSEHTLLGAFAHTSTTKRCWTAFGKLMNESAGIRDAVICMLLFVIGIVFYMTRYSSNFIDAFYWAAITGLAVGFGDIHPETDDNFGYVFVFFYSFILVIYTYRVMATVIKSIWRPSNFKAVLTSTFNPEMITSFDRSNDNVVTRDEYLTATLVMLGHTDYETCDLIMKYFDILNVDGDEGIDASEINTLQRRMSSQGSKSVDVFAEAERKKKELSRKMKEKQKMLRRSSKSSTSRVSPATPRTITEQENEPTL